MDPVSPAGSSHEEKAAFASDEKVPTYSKDAQVYGGSDIEVGEVGEATAEEFVETKELRYANPLI